MSKLKFSKKISRRFFAVANGCLLISAMVLSSCDNADEQLSVGPAEDVETEYAFFDPSDTLNISACDAEDIATAFMDEIGGVDNTFKSKGMRFSCRKTTVIPDDNREPALYAINLDPDGFCIVAATKKTETILAYSDQGKFDINNLPIGLADWISEKIEIIQDVRGTGSAISSRVSSINNMTKPMPSDRWAEEGGGSNNYVNTTAVTTTYGPLLSTMWRQCLPYNYYIPKECNEKGALYGNKAPAGCVSIAMAQILKYYKYPATKYAWSKMKDCYMYETEIDNVTKCVPTLIKDLCDWLNAKYDCDYGTGAYTKDAIDIFEKKFNYKSGGTFARLSESEAEPIVRADIINGRPVIMEGYSKKTTTGKLWKKKNKYSEGHCWVCDGYQLIQYKTATNVVKSTQHFYHMNWGWAICNGWFDFSDTETFVDYQYNRGYLTGIKAQ